jgi:23S rRNA-/tRNA-specific pseudouridylate synthase
MAAALKRAAVIVMYIMLQAHRLDAPTGGLLLVAKSKPALQQMSADLASHRIQKRCV